MRFLMLNWRDPVNPFRRGRTGGTQSASRGARPARSRSFLVRQRIPRRSCRRRRLSNVRIVRRRLAGARRSSRPGRWPSPSQRPFDLVIDQASRHPLGTRRGGAAHIQSPTSMKYWDQSECVLFPAALGLAAGRNAGRTGFTATCRFDRERGHAPLSRSRWCSQRQSHAQRHRSNSLPVCCPKNRWLCPAPRRRFPSLRPTSGLTTPSAP